MSNDLASEVANSALDTIAKALPTSLADRVPIGLVEQVFVWVVQNETDAKELVTILQDNGFKNIKLDDKGTTITATAGGLTATTDSSDSCSADSSTTCVLNGITFEPSSSNCYPLTGTSVTSCSSITTSSDCPNYYQQESSDSDAYPCFWYTGGTCNSSDCAWIPQ